MKAAVIFSALCFAATSVSAFDKIIAYADSFTDNGNDYKASGYPQSPPYWKGRFSNGATWLEEVEKALKGIEVVNVGHGGATSDNAHAYSEFNGWVVPGTLQQVEQIPTGGTPDSLYIISIGYNDLNGIINPDMYKIVKKDYTVDDIVDGVVKTVEAIKKKYGGKNFLIQNCPPFWRWPVVTDDKEKEGEKLQLEYNAATEKALRKVKGIDLQFQDISTFWNDLLDNPGIINLRTDNGPCNPGIGNDNVCSDPESHMFWDSYHPEAGAHKYWGEWATKDIRSRYSL